MVVRTGSTSIEVRFQAGTVIDTIGVSNIVQLASHHVSQQNGRVMRIIEFANGASCEITSRGDGTLEVLHGERIWMKSKVGSSRGRLNLMIIPKGERCVWG